MGGFLNAARFLTILPLGKGSGNLSHNDMRAMARWFYLVGFIIPLPLVFVYHYIFNNLFTAYSMIPAALAVVYFVIITGGLHLDGLADSADGLFGGHNRERRLAIMKQSSTGAFGVISIAIVLLIKFSVIMSVAEPRYLIIMLPLSSMMGRWSMVLAAGFSGYAREEGTGRDFIQSLTMGQALVLSFPPLLLSFASYYCGLIMAGVVALFVFIAILYSKKRIGGVTGDVLGGISEISEILAMLTFAALLNTPLFSEFYEYMLKNVIESLLV